MDVLATGEDLTQGILAGDLGQDPQLDLVVVGREQAWPRGATKQERIGRPTSVRIGMFCRFGLALESRPVAVAVWLKVVWSRPLSGWISSGSASR